jgi:hypothetical protein
MTRDEEIVRKLVQPRRLAAEQRDPVTLKRLTAFIEELESQLSALRRVT